MDAKCFGPIMRNLDEQHSMAFRGLASPSQARARNMHKAERVVRLFAVLLNLASTFAHTKIGQHQMSVWEGNKRNHNFQDFEFNLLVKILNGCAYLYITYSP